jgi:hypothetical protein
MEEVAIPGTPPPPSPSGKVWKPASFIPGLKANSTGGNLNGVGLSKKSNGSTLGMISTDESFRKRIKLPDRIRPMTIPGVNAASVLKGTRRAVDQGAYSTILSAFDMPATSKS